MKRVICSMLFLTVLVSMIFNFMILHVSSLTLQRIPSDHTLIFPTEDSSFLLADISGSEYHLYEIDSKNTAVQVGLENMKVDSAFYADGNLYLSSEEQDFVIIHQFNSFSGKITYGYLFDLQPQINCMTADNTGHIYFVDRRTPNVVQQYLLNGTKQQSFDLHKTVSALFCYQHQIFAVIENQLYSLKENKMILSDIPAFPFYFNANYCMDETGNIYSFNENTGFSQIHTGAADSCIDRKRQIYIAKENCVYLLDQNGKPKSFCEFSDRIDEIYISNLALAVFIKDKISIITEKDFEKIKTIEESNSVSESIVSKQESNIKTVSKTEESRVSHSENTSSSIVKGNTRQTIPYITQSSENIKESEISEENYLIQSDMYSLKEKYIENIPAGTTLAQIKKNIDYGDYQIEFVNHNGKIVTSGQIGTNWTIKFISPYQVKEYIVIILNDITGEGNINSKDTALLAKFLCESEELTEAQLIAADMDQDGLCTVKDLYLLQSMLSF